MCMSIWHRCSPPHVLHVLPIFGESEGDEVDLVLLCNAADCGHIVLAQQGQVCLDVADLQGRQTIYCACCRSASPVQAPGLLCRAAKEVLLSEALCHMTAACEGRRVNLSVHSPVRCHWSG